MPKRKRQSAAAKKDKADEEPLSDLPLIPPSDHDTIRRLWLARRTFKSMLEARGYHTDDVLPSCTLDVFIRDFEHYATTERYLTVPRARPVLGIASDILNDDHVLVFFAISTSTLGVKTVRPMLNYMNEKQSLRAILLVDHGVTPEVRSDLLAYRQRRVPDKRWIEVFRLRELAFPKLQHVLQPKKIELLTLTERNAVLDRYGNKPGKPVNLQYALLRDPIVRFHGALPSDVLRIERKSQTGGTAIAYRYVIHNPRNEKIKAIYNTVL